MNEKEKYDPIKKLNEMELCLHCIHKPICIIKKEEKEFEQKWWKEIPALPRLLSKMAETCKYYIRKGSIDVKENLINWINEMKEKFDIKQIDTSCHDQVYGVNLCLAYLKEFIETIKQ